MPEHVTTAPWEVPYPGSTGEVKKGATDMEEIANRITKILKEKIGGVATITDRTISYTAVAGEWGQQQTAGTTTTLPSVATANQLIVVQALTFVVGSITVQPSGGAEIFANGAKTASIKLYGGQAVVLQSDGVNWNVIAEAGGVSPSSAGAISASTAITETTITPSATRPVQLDIIAQFNSADNGELYIEIGGKEAMRLSGAATKQSWSTWVRPGDTVHFALSGELSHSTLTYKTQGW